MKAKLEPFTSMTCIESILPNEDIEILKQLLDNYKNRKSSGGLSIKEQLEGQINVNLAQISAVIDIVSALSKEIQDLKKRIEALEKEEK